MSDNALLQVNEFSAHIPVLFDEVMDALQPKADGFYLDGTLGLGGHSEGILKRSGGTAHLLGLDRDLSAIDIAKRRLAPFGDNVRIEYACYSQFADVMERCNFAPNGLDGALIDIGVSSLQIDSAERGFSFHADGPLDMRMDRNSGLPPASSLVNKAPFERLKELIENYGEDPQAGRIARAILNARAVKPIETTSQLAEIVEKAYPAQWRAKARNHPATRTFQALRMAVNGELGELEAFLKQIIPFMKTGGRIAVISFHSLEDRLVKNVFRTEAKGCICPSHIPVCVCGHTPSITVLTKKPIIATSEELIRNSRASSAKLRVAEKIAQ